MKIMQVCVGQPKHIEHNGQCVLTSIFKSPMAGPVRVRRHNLDGDRQADPTVHGGRDKAVYAYSNDYYADWATDLGVERLEDAQFGENLAISGGTDDQVVIGSCYRIGEAELVVTQPRIPCYKLGIRLDDDSFPNRFWNRGHLGFYLRVKTEGVIEAGLPITLIAKPDHNITVANLYQIVSGGTPQEASRALDTLGDIDAGWRRRLRGRLSCK
jgi:MOSC domain-containing protein YiiM